MTIKSNAVWVSGFLALTSFMTQLAKADDWNKRTEFQFSAPLEIPGRVLAPGKYIFELVDSDSDRNIVRVFSEDSEGNDTLVTTLQAIPDYLIDTPDKPTVHFEERASGSPEAIHSWFYPGDNTGWQFVYPKKQSLQASANTTPAPAPVAPAAALSLPPAPQAPAAPPAPQVQKAAPATGVTVVEEEVLVAERDVAAPVPAQGAESTAEQTLPQTGGCTDVQLMTGLLMFGGGIAAVFASRRKSLA